MYKLCLCVEVPLALGVESEKLAMVLSSWGDFVPWTGTGPKASFAACADELYPHGRWFHYFGEVDLLAMAPQTRSLGDLLEPWD